MTKEKEILTIEIIRHELKSATRREFIGAMFCLPLFLISLLGSIVYLVNLGVFFRGLISFGFPLCFLYLTVLLLGDVFKTRFVYLKNPEMLLVKDRLVKKESRFHEQRRGPYGEFLYLHFEKYGEYVIQKENYLWSDLYWRYNEDDVYGSSTVGDEFYLVLKNSRTGSIGWAYNTKLFAFQEPESNS